MQTHKWRSDAIFSFGRIKGRIVSYQNPKPTNGVLTPFFDSAETALKKKGRIVKKLSYQKFGYKWRIDAVYRHVVG